MSMPLKLATMVSMSHRNAGQQLFMTQMVSDDATPLDAPSPVAILNASQSSNTITINFSTAPSVPFRVGQVVGIYGFVDTRLNVNSAVVASIVSQTSITIVGNDYTLTSTTINTTLGNGAAFIARMDMLANAYNGLSCVRSNGSASNARHYVRGQGSSSKPSGTIAGSHSITVGTDAASALVSAPFAESFGAPLETIFLASRDGIIVTDRGTDTNSSLTARFRQSQIAPDSGLDYRLRFEVRNTEAITRPVARIVSISKAGSATATVTTAEPHGLTTGQYAGVHGVRDQTNFANTYNAICTVTGTNTFTITLGSSATATSYGGAAILTQGQQPLGGAVAQVAQSVSRSSNLLTVTCNATVGTTSIGNLVEIYGFRDSVTGADLGLDGTYVARNLNSNTLTLEPVSGRAPTGADIATTNCGGAIIQRLGARIHGVFATDYELTLIEPAGKGSPDAGDALPVILSSNIVAAAGTTAPNNAMPNPVAIGGRASNANITAMSVAGNLVAQLMTMIGASVFKPYCLPEAAWQYTGALTTTSDVAASAAAGVGIKNHVTNIQVTNTGSSANSLNIKDGSTIRLTIAVPAGQSIVLPVEAGIVLTANTALNVSLSAAGTMQVNIIGYQAP
jgi:hypothetical protein